LRHKRSIFRLTGGTGLQVNSSLALEVVLHD
jgi:hypothetical protein